MRSWALVAILAAACGDDAPGTGDAGTDTTDADVDADPDVRGPVSIRIVDKNDGPLPGMTVVFIDTDATVTTAVTDSNGSVTASLFPGASATAIRAREGGVSYAMTTVLALNPDDTITLVSAASAASSTEDPFTQRTVPLPSADITTAAKASGVVTITTVAAHGLAVNDRVVISGVSPETGFNGTHTVTATPSATTFNVDIGGGLTSSTGGIAYKALPLTVTFPSYGGASSYEIHTPCGPVDVGTATTFELVLRDGCATSPMDVVVFAKTSSTVEAAYAQQTNVTFTPGATVTITDTWHPVTSISATYSNVTSRVTEVAVDRFSPYVRGTAQSTDSDTTTGGDVALSLSAATPAIAWMKSLLSCPSGSGPDCISSGTGVAQQVISERVDGAQASYALDVGANLLPWVSAVYQPTTTTTEITVTGTGTYDLFETNLRYFRMVDTTQVIYTWRVFGPVAETITFPTLPSTVPGDPTLRPTDTQSAYQVYLCESDALAGYRDAVKNPYHSLATCATPSAPAQRPAGGTKNRLSSWN